MTIDKPICLSEWFRSTCGGIITMYICGPDAGKQKFLRDDPRYSQILDILDGLDDWEDRAEKAEAELAARDRAYKQEKKK